MENIKKITARLKTAEEITGVKGCQEFQGDGWSYIKRFNEIARNEWIIELQDDDGGYYDYKFQNVSHFVKKEWLKDIRREIDWSKVPVDTKLLVNIAFIRGRRRYFSHFEDVQEPKVYYFMEGATSWSAAKTWSCDPEDAELWEGGDR